MTKRGDFWDAYLPLLRDSDWPYPGVCSKAEIVAFAEDMAWVDRQPKAFRDAYLHEKRQREDRLIHGTKEHESD